MTLTIDDDDLDVESISMLILLMALLTRTGCDRTSHPARNCERIEMGLGAWEGRDERK